MRYTDILRRNATRHPDRLAVAMCDGNDHRTYAQLYHNAIRLANALQSVAQPGDRVALLSENSVEYVEGYYGIPAAGMSLVPLNHRLHPKEWAWVLADSDARVLLVSADYLGRVDEIRAELPSDIHIVVIGDTPAGLTSYTGFLAGASTREPDIEIADDDDAWIFYTSGTTGHPKGARLSHRNLITAIIQSVIEYRPTQDTCFLNAMPLCHIAGYLTPLHQFHGGSVLMMSGWDPVQWMRIVEAHRVTSGGFAPTMMQMLLSHPDFGKFDLSSLQWMGYGASKIPVQVLRQTIEAFGPIVYAGMGMTELGGNMITLDKEAHIRAAAGEEHLLDAVGKPMSLVDVRIADSTGNVCPDGVVGEIQVRGDQVTRGYLNNPEATSTSFDGEWFRSGDLAYRDKEGYLYIVDRAKDMIITGGENVYSSEVENAIHTHPGVLSAAVIGTPDERWGELVTAVVVPRAGVTLSDDEIITACRDQLAGFKCPRRVIFTDELPQTSTGKIRKNVLREQYTRT